MILVDTNVVSELMRPAPAPEVLAWFARQDVAALFLSAVSEAELRAGAAYLPAGRRRDGLVAAIDAMVAEDCPAGLVRIAPPPRACKRSVWLSPQARFDRIVELGVLLSARSRRPDLQEVLVGRHQVAPAEQLALSLSAR